MRTESPLEAWTAYENAVVVQLTDGSRKIQHCVDQLSESQVWWRPREEMNSIANLLLHLAGNLRQWLITGLLQTEDLRTRQQEFDDRSQRPKHELMQLLNRTIDESVATIAAQSFESLSAIRRVQEFDVSGFEAIADSVSHFKGHVQEIVHMTRFQLGDAYRFDFIPCDQQQPTEGVIESSQAQGVEMTQPSEPDNTLIRQFVAELQRTKRNAESALADLDDEAFFAQPAGGANSVAVIVKHIAGNLKSRWTDFLESDGEKPWRDRDQEFTLRQEDNRTQLMEHWQDGWQTLLQTVSDLKGDSLQQTVTIRGEDHTVWEAMLRTLSHTSYHVGQVQFLRRQLSPQSSWLSIEPGKSGAAGGRYLQP